ncbi:hypothetical protein HYH03_004259 [Edaphochlamys debaryana]|uniref:Sulfatase N-terminal domain-containing protein n=1 Tax=Edaphochlamys debaryana TaxID=47281 RepID=A0A835Y825_9CHLO|nr:hypothetical protein HYH03_004259 [Edaphochlamys debaryana]|eukprot:KAG2498000.1 hypothetical protein HYH03_004259 [Edaphochlamys debaryana]
MRNFAISSSTCCPSRTSLLSGMFVHNHNITANVPPYGGYEKFMDLRIDQTENWLPVQLQDAGYSVFMVGKFLNGFEVGPGADCPWGFDVLDALVEPYVYTYWGPAFSQNCGPAYKFDESYYSTDVIRDKAIKYIRDSSLKDKPFYLQLNPVAPHGSCWSEDGDDQKQCSDPKPHTRHQTWFSDATIPMSANWLRPLEPSIARYLTRSDSRMDAERLHERHRQRLRSLAAVDEMLRDVVLELASQGMLDSTYIIFSSDNGFHMGQHNAGAGKVFPWEEDIRVPFFVRGPGLPRGVVSDYQTTMVDVPATIMQLAGINIPSSWDGYPIPFNKLMPNAYVPMLGAKANYNLTIRKAPPGAVYLRESMPIEMWITKPGASYNNMNFRSVRVCTSFLNFGTPLQYRQAMIGASASGTQRGSTIGLGNLLRGFAPRSIAGDTLGVDLAAVAAAGGGDGVMGTCYKYTLWCWGAKELYDLSLDPAEINNRMGDPRAARLVARLDAMLAILAYCRGDKCKEQYSTLIGAVGLTEFSQIMDPQYDEQFKILPQFQFARCSATNLQDDLTWYVGGW